MLFYGWTAMRLPSGAELVPYVAMNVNEDGWYDFQALPFGNYHAYVEYGDDGETKTKYEVKDFKHIAGR